jgi:hypothetical protein
MQNIPSLTFGMFGCTAVHVQANKVKPQLQRMSRKVLVSEGEHTLESSVWILVSFRLGSEARTNGTQKRTA